MSRPPTPNDSYPPARLLSPAESSQQALQTQNQPAPRPPTNRSPVVMHYPPPPPPFNPRNQVDPRSQVQYEQSPPQFQSIQPHPQQIQPSPVPQQMHGQHPLYHPPQHPSHHSPPPYPIPNGNGHYQNSPSHPPPTGLPDEGGPRKRQRVPRACDLCSERKVKCGSEGPGSPPCNGCVSMDKPCTFLKATKRRGPVSKYRDDDNRSRQRVEGSSFGPHSFNPESNRETADTLASLAANGGPNANYLPAFPGPRLDLGVLLCDKILIDHLIDDFFTYIHPLAPFPHEPSFRNAYKSQYYLSDPKFLALLCSMVAALVSSFPRKPREHMRNLNLDHKFPTSIAFIDRCHFAAAQARGGGYLDNNLTIYDGCTSYFLGLAAAYTFNWRRTRLYFSETLTIIRALGAHRADVQPLSFPNEDPAVQIDYIQQQIGRRLFWTMVVGVSSIHQIGAAYGELFIPPQTSSNPYPHLPDEIDDEYFDGNGGTGQPPGILSRLAGFNINCKIYDSLQPLSTMEVAFGIDQIYDWNRQKKALNDCYEIVEEVLNTIPPELLLKPGPEFVRQAQQPPTGVSDHIGQLSNETREARRRFQFEVQKANIYASQLCTRSYIVEKFFNLQDAFSRSGRTEDGSRVEYGGLQNRVAKEREGIVQEFLQVLAVISPEFFEPNGLSFVNKVRQVASTLIDADMDRKGPLARQAEEDLSKLLAILVKLERAGPADGVDAEAAEQEEDLRIWADLRVVQLRFLQDGGFMAVT